MSARCAKCNGHGEVIVTAFGDVRAPKLGEAPTDLCPHCNGTGAAPGGDEHLTALDGVKEAA